MTLSYDAFIYIYIYIFFFYNIYISSSVYYIHIFLYICIYNCILFGSMNPLQDCMLSWSFHLLVPLLFCCYAIHSCWCTPMISGHALVACVSISQWWQLSMELFFRFYSVPFPLVCIIYARREWMPIYPCEWVYALWCFAATFGMLHVFRYQPGIWHITNTVHNYSFAFQ